MKFDDRVRNAVGDRLAMDHVIFGTSSDKLQRMFQQVVNTFERAPSVDDLVDSFLDGALLSYTMGGGMNVWFAAPSYRPSVGSSAQMTGSRMTVMTANVVRLYSDHVCIVTAGDDDALANTARLITGPGNLKAYVVRQDLELPSRDSPFECDFPRIQLNFPRDDRGETVWNPMVHGVFPKGWHDAV